MPERIFIVGKANVVPVLPPLPLAMGTTLPIDAD
jgi:hypothetical protein